MFVSSCLVVVSYFKGGCLLNQVIIIRIVKRDSWPAVSMISMFAEKQNDFSRQKLLKSLLVAAFADTNKHTLFFHGAAHHHNMATVFPLHAKQELFYHQAKYLNVKDLLHGSNTLALQWSNHASTRIVHYNDRISCVIICGKSLKQLNVVKPP